MNGYSRADEIATGIRGISTRCALQHSGCGEPAVFIFSMGQGSRIDELMASFASSVALATDVVFSPALIDSLARQLIAAGFAEAASARPPSDAPLAAHDMRGVDDVVRAQVRFYRDICAGVVRRNGATRWGIIHHNLFAEYAVYLRFLFPAAQFVFVRCDPSRCDPPFVRQQPGQLHKNEALVTSFRKHCVQLSASFEHWHDEVNGLLVDCERLLFGDAEKIATFLGIPISDEVRSMWHSIQFPLRVQTQPPSDAAPSIVTRSTSDAASAHQIGSIVPRGLRGPVASSDGKLCAVLVPTSRYIEPECEESLRALEQRGYVVRRLYGCAAIDAARNVLATRALEEGFEETFWIDADVAFEPDAVERIRSHNLPIVCGVCAKKGVRELAAGLLPGTPEIVFGEGGGICEILYAGTGFLHVRREAYETIRDKLSLPTCNASSNRRAIPFFMPMIEQWGDRFIYLAEDYSFCRRARQCGFKIYADTSIRLWHIGNYRYGYEDASTAVARVSTHRYHPPGA